MAVRKPQPTTDTDNSTNKKEKTMTEKAIEGATEIAITGADDIKKAFVKARAEGFKTVAPTVINYYKCLHDGKPVMLRGVPLKRNLRPAGDGYYYIVGLTADCVLFDRDGKAVETKAGPDSYAWVDERSDLMFMAEHLPREMRMPDGTFAIVQCSEVMFAPTQKIEIKGGRTMWKFDRVANPIQPNRPGLPLLAPTTSVAPSPLLTQGEDVPF